LDRARTIAAYVGVILAIGACAGFVVNRTTVNENRGTLCSLSALVGVSSVSDPQPLEHETPAQTAKRQKVVHDFRQGVRDIDCEAALAH